MKELNLVKWSKGQTLKGKFKKLFVNRFGKPMLILEVNKKDVFVNVPTSLRNLLKKGKDLINVNSVLEIECVDLVNSKGKKYYIFSLVIDGKVIEYDITGLDLI